MWLLFLKNTQMVKWTFILIIMSSLSDSAAAVQPQLRRLHRQQLRREHRPRFSVSWWSLRCDCCFRWTDWMKCAGRTRCEAGDDSLRVRWTAAMLATLVYSFEVNWSLCGRCCRLHRASVKALKENFMNFLQFSNNFTHFLNFIVVFVVVFAQSLRLLHQCRALRCHIKISLHHDVHDVRQSPHGVVGDESVAEHRVHVKRLQRPHNLTLGDLLLRWVEADIRGESLKPKVSERPALEHEILLPHGHFHATLENQNEVIDRLALVENEQRRVAFSLRLDFDVPNNVLIQQTSQDVLVDAVSFERFKRWRLKNIAKINLGNPNFMSKILTCAHKLEGGQCQLGRNANFLRIESALDEEWKICWLIHWLMEKIKTELNFLPCFWSGLDRRFFVRLSVIRSVSSCKSFL